MNQMIKLGREATELAIETAIRTQAKVEIDAALTSESSLNGYLISGDEKALLVELSDASRVRIDQLQSQACNVLVYSERRYRFPSKVLTAPTWGDTQAIAIQRPTEVTVIDRRQFLRARLAPSSRVRLVWTRSGTECVHTGTLLNVSVNGLACRVDEVAAAAIRAGDTLSAVVQLPGNDHTLQLPAVVSNMTPASAGCTILGLQFEKSKQWSAAQSALRAAMQPEAMAETGDVYA